MKEIKRLFLKIFGPRKKFFFFIFLTFLIISGLAIGLKRTKIDRFLKNFKKGGVLISGIIFKKNFNLVSYKNRVNFLFLGIGGENHSGGDLTDTMIFVSVNKDTADTVMFSIPRDIWVDSLGTKINAVYHYGEEKNKGDGFNLLKNVVFELFGQPVHYIFLVDFQGFKKIVNLLGGIEIKVERSFDDYKYPIFGKENDDCGGDKEYKCRWEHIHFEAGWQRMDGETALKFIRSRNAQGEEGTDFARSQRQQKVIKAIKDKITSFDFWRDPQKLEDLKKEIENCIKTDGKFTQDQEIDFLKLFWRFLRNKNTIRTIVLDYGDEENLGFLYNPKKHFSGQWVLLPRAGNWEEVKKYVGEKIEKGY